MKNRHEGLKCTALGAVGLAVAAIVNPGNVNAQVQLQEERVLLDCEQGKGPRESKWQSIKPAGSTMQLGQLDCISRGDGKWKVDGVVEAIDNSHLEDLPRVKKVFKSDSNTILFRYGDSIHKLHFSPGVPEMPGEQATTVVMGESRCIDVK
jgi:hypothetical protein